MTPIRYTRAQVALMLSMASTDDFALLAGKKETPASLGLQLDSNGYVWQPR